MLMKASAPDLLEGVPHNTVRGLMHVPVRNWTSAFPADSRPGQGPFIPTRINPTFYCWINCFYQILAVCSVSSLFFQSMLPSPARHWLQSERIIPRTPAVVATHS
jgi:hypothetical protein